MKPFTTYGIKCVKKDEKNLVKKVNDFLAIYKRTMSKAKNKSLLEAHLPFVYKYFYWNMNKSVGTWFEIFPNEDEKGKFFSEEHKKYGWLIKTRIDVTHPMYKKEKTEKFLSDLLKSIEYETVIIKENEEEE